MPILYDRLPASVRKDLLDAIPLVGARLSEEQLVLWANEGVALADRSLRSWEAAAEYFRASPAVAGSIGFDCVMEWVACGGGLAEKSAALAISYFQASPTVTDLLRRKEDIGRWARTGLDLYDGNWKSGVVAGRFFEISPELLKVLDLPEISDLVSLTIEIGRKSSDLAQECLELAPQAFASVERSLRPRYVAVARTMAANNCFDIKAYFKSGPAAILRVHRPDRAAFLDLLQKTGASSYRDILPLMNDGPASLARIESSLHGRLLEMAGFLLPHSASAGVQFLKNSSVVMGKGLSFAGLSTWYDNGFAILKDNREAGEAYFSLESGRGQKLLESLSAQVELSRVDEVLRLYCCALTARKVKVSSLDALAESGANWLPSEKPITDGRTVYLPSRLERYPSRKENFTWLKVAATHQAGHIEFGSFDFSWEREAALFANRRGGLQPKEAPDRVADFKTLFSCFEDARLASDIFTIAEDCRVDHRVKRQYPGLKASYEWVQQEALSRRQPLSSLPMRQAFVELLLQASLSSADVPLPKRLARFLRYAVETVQRLKSAEAAVEDSVEATIRLYEMATSLPNVVYLEADWARLTPEEMESLKLQFPIDGSAPPVEGPGKGSPEQPYEPAGDVEFRGEFKPEIVQLMLKARETLAEGLDIMSLSPETVKELIGKKLEIEFNSGEVFNSSGTFASDIESPAPPPTGDEKLKEHDSRRASKAAAEGKPADDEPLTYSYDEWDFRAGDYRPSWCVIREHWLPEGGAEFYNDTLKENHGLALRIKKQFEQLAPELFKKIRRLQNGDEFDLDPTIEAVIDRKMGGIPDDRIYWRRNKVERDVATVFLLDMSASTAEVIAGKPPPDEADFAGDPRDYFNWLRAHPIAAKPDRTIKRIIDVEKDGIVLLVNAMEVLGDKYGIYAFSGYGRQNVEFLVLKEVGKAVDDGFKKRIDKITPLHATRMGTAIRHATSKLEACDNRTKILFLISDGRPQDQGYGRDGMEKEYAIHDTRKALLEAKHKGITPFCLTVDKSGQDYLRTMCRDMGYEVLENISSLPERIPALYRRLTT